MTLLCALLAAVSTWLAIRPPAEPRVARWSAPAERRSPPKPAGGRLAWVASGVAGLGAGALLGGLVGVGVAVGCLLLLPRAVSRLESAGDRRRREGLARQLPQVASLLAATLASGATLHRSLAVVADAVGEPTRSALDPVLAAMDLGADAAEAWRTAGIPPEHDELVSAIVRSLDSGAPLSRVLGQIAQDAQRRRRAAVEVAARSAGVRAVAPLAACFLPAFLLLGVVPVVASLAGALLGGS